MTKISELPTGQTINIGSGQVILSAGRLTLASPSVATNNPLVYATQTWNNAGVTFHGIHSNITDTASGAGSTLILLQVGGSNRFLVTKDGSATFAGNLSVVSGYVSAATLTLATRTTLRATDYNVFDQYSGSSAQTYNLFNTRTDATTFEMLSATWAANVAYLTTVKGSVGGSARNLAIGPTDNASGVLYANGANRWLWNGSAELYPATNATGSLGTSTNRVASAYVDKLLIAPTLNIPNRFYGVEGEQTWIDLDGLGVWPLGIGAYEINIDCYYVSGSVVNLGVQSDRAWYCTPVAADVGDRTWTISVYHQGVLVATATTTYRIKAATMSSTTRKVLAIGDSLTSNGIWLSELVNQGVDGNLTVTTVGSVTSSSVNDSDSTARTVKHDGIAGANLAYFYANASSAFVNGGSFDFANYLTAQSISLSADDWIIICLGINDVTYKADDAEMATAWTTQKTQLDAMIAAFQAAVSGVRVAVALPCPPAATQHAFGDDYLAGLGRARYKRNHDLWCGYVLAEYGGREASDIYVLPLHCCLDTENNFYSSGVAANVYNATTVTRQTNALHPAPSGSFQIGQAVYGFMRGQE